MCGGMCGCEFTDRTTAQIFCLCGKVPAADGGRYKRRRDAGGTKLQATDEEFAFVDHFFRKMVVELDEEFFVVDDFALP